MNSDKQAGRDSVTVDSYDAMNEIVQRPLVGIIMGSRSDWETMQGSVEILERAGVPYEAEIVSAHRTPEKLFTYAGQAEARGLRVIIAGAGGAAHLPGMTAALTCLPVLGVPVRTKFLGGVDSLLSIVQMPAGIPVGSFAIGSAGAKNAALFAISILGIHAPEYRKWLHEFRQKQTQTILTHSDPRACL